MQSDPELKRFAFSAERRTSDTLLSLNRLHERIADFLINTDDEITKTRFESLLAENQTLQDSILSSRADWIDIIGDEIKIKEEVNRKLEIYKSNPQLNGRDLDEIKDLLKQLPTSFIDQINLEPSEPIVSSFILDYLIRNIERNKGFLKIHATLDDYANIDVLKNHEPLNFVVENGMSNLWLCVVDINQNSIGVITNPFGDLVNRRDFYFTLIELISEFIPTELTEIHTRDVAFSMMDVSNYNFLEEEKLIEINIAAKAFYK